ncbi:nuclease-related domain-containing protein [Flavobacterium sp. NG2]|uniref:nuclease-related domain-containing protein n=1 Tax=Flavobacterium sp. NG2 TaxID=3097547 RepID=UPI002A81E4D0|nr:nuclease-related domain-containing protein [Flavobacterium sp. NG2]WPR70952.1 nuclease-related domain-containing protein [Flavobacterium sp. NG2]
MIVFGILLISLIFLYFFRKIKDRKLLATVTKRHRGTKTERQLVLKLLKSGFPAQTIFHDLYIRNRYGNYSQIDVAVATKVGIIVFEVKDYSGWIFGTGHQQKWTQVLAYGKQKYYFYNPILQNKKHVEDLKTKLTDFQNIPFYSVVVFFGNCEFRDVSFIPKDTFLVKSNRVIEVVKKIINENQPAIYKSKRDVVNVLTTAVLNGDNKEISNKHIENIKDMLGKDRIFD